MKKLTVWIVCSFLLLAAVSCQQSEEEKEILNSPKKEQTEELNSAKMEVEDKDNPPGRD